MSSFLNIKRSDHQTAWTSVFDAKGDGKENNENNNRGQCATGQPQVEALQQQQQLFRPKAFHPAMAATDNPPPGASNVRGSALNEAGAATVAGDCVPKADTMPLDGVCCFVQVNNAKGVIERRLASMGARVCAALGEEVTHVIFSDVVSSSGAGSGDGTNGGRQMQESIVEIYARVRRAVCVFI